MKPVPLHTAIQAAIADPGLRIALTSNAERRVRGRISAFESLPDWRERRVHAHAVRAEVIEHLDAYLEQFSQQARTNGINVHRAHNAAEALQIVLEIAAGQKQAEKTLLFAKSKSMISEEIELNPALEAAGHRVVETDLGEFIIQLRGERPSHLIAPAIHLRRGQVGQLFHEKLGIPYTEEISTLTNTARKVLREVFLTADIGLSGVNFGVAESGSLCIVTNEGNGRMVTPLPKIHVALMGMERLVPTLTDLALMLSLLARSATGQKMSVYTQIINQPLTGQTRHVIILDNGRSTLRESPLRESLYCIRCGACLNVCPVFREMGGHAYRGANGEIAPYPGPIGSVISPGLLGENFVQLAQISSLCGACKDACPVEIDLPKMLLRVRAGQMPSRNENFVEGQGLAKIVKLGLSGFSQIAARPRLFAASQKIAGWALTPFPAFLPLPAFTGWGFSKDFPKPASKSFRERWKEMGKQETRKQEVSRRVCEIPVQPDNRPTVQPSNQITVQPDNRIIAQSELIKRFTAELETLSAQVSILHANELTPRLVAFLRERGVTRAQAWKKISSLNQADMAEAGIQLERSPAPDITVGITGALCAIAETGTLLLHEGADFYLTASLVPEIHLVVVQAAQIVTTLEEALALPQVKTASALALISGPSRTADIEMVLTLGVHGPGEVHVFIVDG